VAGRRALEGGRRARERIASGSNSVILPSIGEWIWLVGSQGGEKRETVEFNFYPNFAVFSYPICFTESLEDALIYFYLEIV